MTSTGTYSGMNLEKPSSKVMAPPGGASNVFFGGYEDQAVTAPKQTTPKNVEPESSASPQSAQPIQQTNNKPKRYNPITGEEINGDDNKDTNNTGTDASTPKTEQNDKKPDSQPQTVSSSKTDAASTHHTFTRVRQPPGGASTPLW